jgi:hypothetical protein
LNGTVMAANQRITNAPLLNVPAGRKFQIHIATIVINSVGVASFLVKDPDQGDTTAWSHYTQGAGNPVSSTIVIWCGVGPIIALLAGAAGGSYTVYVDVLGWWDTRDKDS